MDRQIDMVVIHCSDSEWGNAEAINQWHLERGWSGIGYHAVILNGLPTSHGDYNPQLDGLLESGRPLDQVGAHAKGFNARSAGICMIGKEIFTGPQEETLLRTIIGLLKRYKLDPEAVYGHYELDDHKTCPNLDMDMIREKLWDMWS